MNKPVGVVIIAVLEFLAALFLVLAGVGLILGGGMLASVLSHNSQISGSGLAGAMAGLGVVLAVVFFVFAAMWALVGWGMLGLKNWARITTMVLCGLGICFAALGLLFSLLHFHMFVVVSAAIRIAICGVIIWYLLQPHVKAAFEGRPMTATA